MKIGRNVPPAAAPIAWKDLWHGVIGLLFPERSLRLFEEEIRAHFGVSHVFLVSSGTAALTLTLMGLRSSSRRTDVVIPAYTCPSVPAAVLKAGLRPVLCDINPSTFDFDHALLERTLTRTPCASLRTTCSGSRRTSIVFERCAGRAGSSWSKTRLRRWAWNRVAAGSAPSAMSASSASAAARASPADRAASSSRARRRLRTPSAGGVGS